MSNASEGGPGLLRGARRVMASLDQLGAVLACESLIVHFTHLIDLAEPTEAADLFCVDGVLVTPGHRYEGRDEIARALHERPAGLVTRHVMSNIAVDVTGERDAVGFSYLTRYRHDPAAETHASTTPVAVGEFRDTLRRDDDGVWRFAERTLTLAMGSLDGEATPA